MTDVMRGVVLVSLVVAASVVGSTEAEAQAAGCGQSAAELWAPVPWSELAPEQSVVTPGADEDYLYRTLEIDGGLMVATVLDVRSRGYRRPTDAVAVWRLQCRDGRWRYVDGFVDGSVETVSRCGPVPEVAVMRLEAGPRVEGTFVRIEVTHETCGTLCGTSERRFLLVHLGDADADRAFACTTHSDIYVVGSDSEGACTDQDRRRLVRYASGGRIRTRQRLPESGPWVVFRWNGRAFVDEQGQSDCDPRIRFAR